MIESTKLAVPNLDCIVLNLLSSSFIILYSLVSIISKTLPKDNIADFASASLVLTFSYRQYLFFYH